MSAGTVTVLSAGPVERRQKRYTGGAEQRERERAHRAIRRNPARYGFHRKNRRELQWAPRGGEACDACGSKPGSLILRPLVWRVGNWVANRGTLCADCEGREELAGYSGAGPCGGCGRMTLIQRRRLYSPRDDAPWTCSHRCTQRARDRAEAESERQERPVRSCLVCGEDLPAKLRAHAKTCSVRCRVALHRGQS